MGARLRNRCKDLRVDPEIARKPLFPISRLMAVLDSLKQPRPEDTRNEQG